MNGIKWFRSMLGSLKFWVYNVFEDKKQLDSWVLNVYQDFLDSIFI